MKSSKTNKEMEPILVLGQKMYNSQQTAEILGISAPTLAALRKKKTLPAVFIKGGKYTSEKAIQDYLNGKTLIDEYRLPAGILGEL